MKFSVNIKSISSSFPLPCDIADKYIKLASGVQLKALILVMRDLSSEIDAESIADKLSISLTDAEDALLFWVRCGVLLRQEVPKQEPSKKIIISNEQPTRRDVIMRGMEDEKVRLILREAQLKFGRNLKNNESKLLVSLYDDYGMDVTVILLLLQHAASVNKINLAYIRSTAVKWLKAGVENVQDGEDIIAKEARTQLAFSIVCKAFGIEKRMPSEKESQYSNTWVNQWGMSSDMLKAAYDVCIDSKAKLSFPYINKVLEKWHTAGYKTVLDVKNGEKKSVKTNKSGNAFAGYDLDAFEAKLNSD